MRVDLAYSFYYRIERCAAAAPLFHAERRPPNFDYQFGDLALERIGAGRPCTILVLDDLKAP